MCDDKDLVATCGGIIGPKWQIIKTSYRDFDKIISLVIDHTPMTARKKNLIAKEIESKGGVR